MPHGRAPEIDFRALAREIRAHGIACGKEANRLLEEGKDERGETLGDAAQALNAIAERLEAWRRHQGEALRRLGLAANTPAGIAEALEAIARQLDAPNQAQGGHHG